MSRRKPIEASYVFPRQVTEGQRLDLTHHVLKAYLGANWQAPIEHPTRVLDAGCGSGLWAFELCEEFPQAAVVGLDLAAHPDRGPGNYRFVRANLLNGLPFCDGTFDFVHQRLLVSGIPVRQWPCVVAELVRVTQPGGWVELVETAVVIEPEGPATARLMGLLRRLFSGSGLDTLAHIIASLDRYLTAAGLVHVKARTLRTPLGEWGGPLGRGGAAGGRAMFSNLAPAFEARFGLPVGECHELVARMLEEFEIFQSTMDFRLAYGQRPAG